MANLMPYDELNTLKQYFSAEQAESGKIDPRDAEDEILDLLILAYVLGIQSASASLGIELTADPDTMKKSVYQKVADKDFAERARESAASGDVADLALIAETDAHRVYSEAVIDAARQSGKNAKKKWQTMKDDRVRDAHWLLDGVAVGIDERFYVDGDSALGPGGFERADLNCGCRCWIDLIPAE